MAADEPSGAKPAPVVLRIKLRYEDVDTLVERFAPNVGKTGLFLPTRSVRPVGSEVRFELRLANDTPALVGLGKVRAVREPDPANPKAAFGMAIELTRVTPQSRELILRMLERRRALGLGDTALPIPDDAAASQRSDVESTGVRDLTAETPPRGTTLRTSAPLPPTSAPAPAEPVFTAPRSRRSSIGISVQRDSSREPSPFAIAPLAAEPPRARRPRLSEVMAAGRTAGRERAASQTDPLDASVDVAAAVARARVLAGSVDLDGELAALREESAAPIEISIEAASAELARQLGGLAVGKRDREISARWAPPPPAVMATVLDDVQTVPAATIAAATSAPASAPASDAPITASPVNAPAWPAPSAETAVAHPHEVTRLVELASPVEITRLVELQTESPAESLAEPSDAILAAITAPERPRRFVTAPIATTISRMPSPSGLLIDDHIDADEFAASVAAPSIPDDDVEDAQSSLRTRAALSPLPDDHDDDDDDREHTQFTQLEGSPFDRRDLSTHPMIPGDADAIAARLDAELAAADRDDSLGGADEPADDHVEEINDFEIIAEADADDADLLLADGEADASGVTAMPQPPEPHIRKPTPVARPSTFDFATRLDLGDDEPSAEHAAFPRPRHADQQPALADDDELDAGDLGGGLGATDGLEHAHADEPAAFDDPVSFVDGDPAAADAAADASGSRYDDFESEHEAYVGGRDRSPAGYAPPVRFESEHAEFSIAPLVDSVDVPLPEEMADSRHSEPYVLGAPAVAVPGDDNYDLEAALDSLDVDLDDLGGGSVPDDAVTPPRGRAATGRPLAGRPVSRRTSNRFPVERVPTMTTPAPAPAPAPRSSRPVRLPRATSDDGVMIDFDDDDHDKT